MASDVVDALDVELLAHARHAAAFQLEHADRFAPVEHGDRLRVVEGDGFQIEVRLAQRG